MQVAVTGVLDDCKASASCVQELSRRRCPVRDTADLPFDFCGGFVGYLGYELKVECGAKANEHQSPFPDAAFFLADKVVAIDHTEGDAYIVEVVDMGQTETETEMIVSKSDEAASLEDGWTVNGDAAAPKAGSDMISQGRSSNNRWGLFSRPVTTDWIERTASVIVDLLEIREMQTLAQSPSSHTNAFPTPASNGSGGVRKKVAAGHADSSAEAQYLEDVRTCMEEIRNGETYEVRGGEICWYQCLFSYHFQKFFCICHGRV
jgi:anthranilate/para-aminobenzoate synthase component I